MNIFLVALALVVNLLRGSPKNASIINIQKCGGLDWSILLGFILLALTVSFLAIGRMRHR